MTAGTSVYRIRLAVTGVEEHGAVPLTGPELFANYPNPFNGISHFGPGIYERAFEAGGLSSGAYLYRLDAGGHASTRIMVLVR